MSAKTLRFKVGHKDEVSGLLLMPDEAQCLYVLAHGAGAGMGHPFMKEMAEDLFERGIATFRYQFPYMEAGRKRPDHRTTLLETVRYAVDRARSIAPGLTLLAGGKSMGGRMTSQAQAEAELEGVSGLVFLGFPLHPPGQPGSARGDHLDQVKIPMLFVQGTRDSLADPERMRSLSRRLGNRARLHIVEGGDHSFKVLKRSGRDQSEVMDEIVDAIERWLQERWQ